MQRKFTSGSRQAPDPYDQFLEDNNYFRKHTARDSSCLFRVISEQMYDTQLHHMAIRKKCVKYMAKNRKLFQMLIEKDLDEYLDDLSKPKTYGTLVELQAIGYMFKRNIILFEPFNLGNYLNKRNFYDGVFRVFYTPERHFDSVFTADYIQDAAICQSICYDILYTEIYKLPDVGFAVEKMLHSSNLEDGVVQTEFNNEGYCKRIFINDGRVFNMDLPNNTNCILENYEWCHFHCVNFPRISSELQQKLVFYKNGNKYHDNDANYLMSLTRTADALLPNKYVSCVRQLLKEGITPFPYKVAKALDANMYRNIEFDSWNEARKENKYSNWYNGDNNFKVGAKCYVRLHKSDEEPYTCHIQDISLDNGYCLVFIERLGEKRLVPYEALSALPPEQFKPWSMPYSWQRSTINRHNKMLNKYDRQLYCSMRYHSTFARSHYIRSTNNVISKKPIYDMHPPYYVHEKRASIGYNNLRHLLHIDNFTAPSMQYYTMPLSITHAVQEASNTIQVQEAITTPTHHHTQINTNTNSTSNELTINTQPDDTSNNGHLVSAYEQNAAQIELNEEGANGNVGPYYVPQYNPYCDDYNVYYGNNGTGYLNGGVMYFMNNPSPQPQAYAPNVYMPAPPILTPTAGVIPYNTAPASYYTATPYCCENNDIVKMEGGGGDSDQMTPAMRDLNNGNSATTQMLINYQARPSTCPMGNDLPVDVATLRYFYNLGIDYHQKMILSKESAEDSSNVRNDKSPLCQITDNMRNMVLDENANVPEIDPNNNKDTLSNANLEATTGPMDIKSNNQNPMNSNNYNKNNTNNDNNNNCNNKDNNTAATSGSPSSSNLNVVPASNHEGCNGGFNYNNNNYHQQQQHHNYNNRGGYAGNRRPNNTPRQFNKERYNYRNQNSESHSGNGDALLSTPQYNRGNSGNVAYEYSGGKPHYRNSYYTYHNTTYKKSNSTTHHNNYHNSSYACGGNNSSGNTHNSTTSMMSNGNLSATTQSPHLTNTPSVAEPTYAENNNIMTQSNMPDAGCAIQVPQNYVPISTNMTQNYSGGYNEFSAGNATSGSGVYLSTPMPQPQPYCVYTMPPPAPNQGSLMPGAAGPYIPTQAQPHQAPHYYGRGGYWREDMEASGHDVNGNTNNGVVMPCYSYPPAVPVFYTPPGPPPPAPSNALLPTPTTTPSQNYWSMPPPTLPAHGPLQNGTMNTMHTMNGLPNIMPPQSLYNGISCTSHTNNTNNNNHYMPTTLTAAAASLKTSSSMKSSHRREKAA